MSRLLLVSLLVLGPSACSDAPCVVVPCPLSIALILGVTSSSAARPVGNVVATYGAPYVTSVNCTGDGGCFIPGAPGAYEVDIAAPGFLPVHKSIVVTGSAGSEGGCPRCSLADTQHITVVLTPTT